MMLVRFMPVGLVIAAVLLASAGRIVTAFIVYPAIVWLTFGLVYTILADRRPDLVRERMRPPGDRDRASRRMALPLLLVHYLIAGLDVRLGWSSVAIAAQLLGFVMLLAGLGFAAWTLFANPYASSAVRVQAERHQTVVSTGPYALVRHPMYLGVVLCSLGSGPALGSWVASLVLLPMIAVFIRRTRLEDRMLHAELDGYSDYASRVRWKVIPLVY